MLQWEILEVKNLAMSCSRQSAAPFRDAALARQWLAYLSLMLHLSLCSGRLDTGLRPHLYIPFMELINGFLAPWFSGSR